MKTQKPIVTKLEDYAPYGFDILGVELFFDLQPKNTLVRSVLKMRRTGTGELFLDGEEIKLHSLKIDGKAVSKQGYRLSKTGLTIFRAPDEFTLEIETSCNPAANSTLMGLYVSGGRFCTQCEAQGFRRITFFPDRPDVLTTYKVRIEADKKAYPTLLANGNCTDAGDLSGGRHFAVWEDPFPKPCYLFALVAGGFDILSDEFTTMSGRNIPLDIYVDPGDAPRAAYAMDALKRSMKWDEEVFGREYDLDRFMIVAVRDFNFGAMENKGLNIFNSSLLLADEASATDMNFELIESVIAHEYFHNWSGNRITCRDWFQLCLKEGFTVFRDQEFSADMRGAALQRIKDVKALRGRQFPEDAGPLSHPVRPSSYMKIDNFYTATIYEKGAELVRMIKTMLGAEMFRKGSDYYFETYDGTAATVEDFVTSFEKVSGQNLSQFMLWYEQAGTPQVKVETVYDAVAKTYDVSFTQALAATPGQAMKKPQLMPIKMGLLDSTGKNFGEEILVFKDKTLTHRYENISEKPVLSAFCAFSAPVTVVSKQAPQDRLALMKSDPDLFNRWEAGQALARDILTNTASAIETGGSLKDAATCALYTKAVSATIRDKNMDDGFKAMAITPPGDGAILQALTADGKTGADPLAIRQAIKMLRRAIAETSETALESLYEKLSVPAPFSPDAKGAGRRALRNTCLSLLSEIPGGKAQKLAQAQFETATNMTEELSALLVLVRGGGAAADEALQSFYDKWQNNPLVIDKWFAACAQMHGANALGKIETLTKHGAYVGENPNRVRSLIGGFAAGNPELFHRLDGSGYRFYADNVMAMDKQNPQVAARLLGAFGIWNKLDTVRQDLVKTELRRILAAKPSANVLEIATKSLGD